jgi:uncharacterized membrane protein
MTATPESGTRQKWFDLPLGVLAGVIVLYVMLFAVFSLARYNTFHASTFDLGIMAQVTWNTSQGRWFETSLDRSTDTELVGSYLSNHVRPLLLLLAPLYRLWPDPRMLLVLQSVALGLAAWPLYAIARDSVSDSRVALIVACCYLAYPALGFLNLIDFHPMALTIPLLYVAYWALSKERLLLFWVCVGLALFAKEEMVVPLGTWGAVLCLQRERRRLGMVLMAVVGAWALLCFGLVIPYFNEGRPYRFFDLWSHLPGLSTSPAVEGGPAQPLAATSPQMVVLFLIHLALPLGFLPLLGYRSLLVSLPALAYLLSAKWPAAHSVGYQYPAVLIPWLFLAVVEGLRAVRGMKRPAIRQRVYRFGLAFMVIGTLGTHVLLNPLLLSARADTFRRDDCHSDLVAAIGMIPPDAGVATVNRLGTHVVNRRVLVTIDHPPPLRLDHVALADYVLLDLVDCRMAPGSNPRETYADAVTRVLDTDLFRVRYWSGRVLLLEKGEPEEASIEQLRAYIDALVEQGRPCWP